MEIFSYLNHAKKIIGFIQYTEIFFRSNPSCGATQTPSSSTLREFSTQFLHSSSNFELSSRESKNISLKNNEKLSESV